MRITQRATLRIIGLLLGTLLSATAYAQTSSVYFPYVVNNTETSTELILTNYSNREANVTLTAYRDDGVGLALVPLKIGAAAQIVVGPATFPAFQGWVLGSSDSDGLQASVRVSAVNGSAVDVAEPAQQDTVIVLPLMTESSGASTEFSVVNPTTSFARVNLTVYASNGSVVAVTDKTIAPLAQFRGSLPSVFGSGINFASASHLVARSNPLNIFSPIVNIMGFEVVRGFARTPSDPSLQKIIGVRDWAALPAVPASAGTSSMVFPHVFRLTDWVSLIGLVNLSNSPQTVNLTYSATASTRSLSIPAMGSIQMTAIDLFGPGVDSGFVKVTGTGSLAGYAASGLGSSFAASPAQASALRDFSIPTVDESPGAFTGIVLQNDGSTASTAEMYLISDQGVTFGRHTELIQPHDRVVKLVRDYFPEGLNQSGGHVFVRSTEPLFAIAALGVADKTLSQLSGARVSSAFNPPPQTLFSIRGRITENSSSAPVADVSVVLSSAGTANVTSTTDSNGEFVFKSLTVADYVVTPVQSGRMFSPLNAPVRLDTASTTVNFRREVPPAMESITVVTTDTATQATAGNNPDPFAIFGTSQVSLKITGSNFVSGQKVFFGSREIAPANVNLVDSQTLFVKLVLDSPEILQELTAKGIYSSYDITIMAQPPFDATRSNALHFYVLPPLPVVLQVTSSSSGTAETFARYEVNSPGETLTVTGFGFRPGARVLFDESGAVGGVEIDTKFISSTSLQAFLPGQALRFGGVYTVRVRNTSQLPEVSAETVKFTVYNLRPLLNPLPPMAIVGPGPQTPVNIPITGTNFHPPGEKDPGTLITIYLPFCPEAAEAPPSGTFPATYISSTQMVATNVPIDCAGTYYVTASNYAPGGGVSDLVPLVITAGPAGAVPVIRAIDPLSPPGVSSGSPTFNLTVFRDPSGAPFQTDAWVNFGTVRLARIAGSTSPDSITVSVPGFLVASPGVVPITVTNPGTGGTTGGTSARVLFTVN